MANVLYNKAREKLIAQTISWPNDTIKAVLIDTAQYTFSASHEFLSSVPAGARVATLSGQLTSKTYVSGELDAADTTITAVAGVTVEAVILYVSTGTDSTSSLFAYIDTATNLPLTPNGSDVTIVWPSTSPFICRI